MGEIVLEEVPKEIDFDFEKIKKIIFDEIVKRGIKNRIQKILLSLQSKGGKSFLLGTIFTSGFGLLKITINLTEKKVVDFEKKSFFDMMKIFGKGK